jgi:hypothetical protein
MTVHDGYGDDEANYEAECRILTDDMTAHGTTDDRFWHFSDDQLRFIGPDRNASVHPLRAIRNGKF